MASPPSPIRHVVIIFKENHTFDNYFGQYPGANGDSTLAAASDPPTVSPSNNHDAWLNRATRAVREQYSQSQIPAYFAYAKQYTLCDNYYTDVASDSTPNHLMLIAADSPLINNPGPNPNLNLPSLPANLTSAGVSWLNYGGFVFKYITSLANSPNNVQSAQFAKDAAAGKLPSVSFLYAPSGLDEHPRGSVANGMSWTVSQVNAVVQGGLWPSTAIFITWDDWGGWYDHVNPPDVEPWTDGTQFRYGSRVPCLVLGPYAKGGYISKVQHSHVSLMKFCESLFGLPTLNQRDAAADGMADCFDYTQTPVPPPTTATGAGKGPGGPPTPPPSPPPKKQKKPKPPKRPEGVSKPKGPVPRAGSKGRYTLASKSKGGARGRSK
jgi:phospholipase C